MQQYFGKFLPKYWADTWQIKFLKLNMKKNNILTLLCLLIFPNMVQANNAIEVDDSLYAPDDSLHSKQLRDVEVTGDREWTENGIINCIPTKSERRLSNSPASLIKTMHLTY